MSLELVPLTFEQAASFVDGHHRHHRRPVGHKWSTGVVNGEGVLVGVSMVGRPVARHLDDGRTLEVNRTCTDGYPNVVVAELPPRSGWWAPSRPRTDRGTDAVARTLWEAS